MKVVVIGGRELIGMKLVAYLGARFHQAIPASPNTGVNTLTGEGLARVLTGASVVIDVSSSQSCEDTAVMELFQTSTRNLIAAEAAAGVKHHVALSPVGIERLSESGYFRARIAQERLMKESPIPYSIVRATQCFDLVESIADAASVDGTVRLAPVLVQPMAADDVTDAVGTTALGSPLDGTVEIAGPEQLRLDAFVRTGLRARRDRREVVADPHARYFGAELGERTLLPDAGAHLGRSVFEEWLTQLVQRR